MVINMSIGDIMYNPNRISDLTLQLISNIRLVLGKKTEIESFHYAWTMHWIQEDSSITITGMVANDKLKQKLFSKS